MILAVFPHGTYDFFAMRYVKQTNHLLKWPVSLSAHGRMYLEGSSLALVGIKAIFITLAVIFGLVLLTYIGKAVLKIRKWTWFVQLFQNSYSLIHTQYFVQNSYCGSDRDILKNNNFFQNLATKLDKDLEMYPMELRPNLT